MLQPWLLVKPKSLQMGVDVTFKIYCISKISVLFSLEFTAGGAVGLAAT